MTPKRAPEIEGSNVSHPIDRKREQYPIRADGTEVNCAAPCPEDIDDTQNDRSRELQPFRKIGEPKAEGKKNDGEQPTQGRVGDVRKTRDVAEPKRAG